MCRRSAILLMLVAMALVLCVPSVCDANQTGGASGDGEVVTAPPDVDAMVGAPVPEGPPPKPLQPEWHDRALGRVFFAIGILVFLASVVRMVVRRGS